MDFKPVTNVNRNMPIYIVNMPIRYCATGGRLGRSHESRLHRTELRGFHMSALYGAIYWRCISFPSRQPGL